MWSAVAPCLAGVLAASAAASVVEATPRALLLAAHQVLVASVRQLALEVLALEEAALVVVSAHAAEAEVVSVVIAASAVEEVVSVGVEAVEDSEEVEVASATNPTATVRLMAHLPGLADHERAALEVDAAVVLAATADQEEDATRTDVEAVVGMIGDRAARTTSPWAAETDPATAVETVGIAATTAHESAVTKATATTIRDNEGDTKPFHRLQCASARVCQGYLPFFRLIISRQ
jgi:hypothetical protein